MSIYKRGDVYWYKFNGKARWFESPQNRATIKWAARWKRHTAHHWQRARWALGSRSQFPQSRSFVRNVLSRGASQRQHRKHGETFIVWDFWQSRDMRLWRTSLLTCRQRKIADFASHRQAQGLQVSSVNSSLRILRRVFRVAVEWGELALAHQSKNAVGRAPQGAGINCRRGSAVSHGRKRSYWLTLPRFS